MTERRRDARGLLRWMFVGRPPSEPPGRVGLTLTFLGFPVCICVMAFTWGVMPPFLTLAFFGVWVSGVLGTLGRLASYHRWRGGRPGELLRLGSGLSGLVFMALFVAHIVLSGHWVWFWWTAFVLALATVVSVAGYVYGPDGEPDAEVASSAERGTSD